MHCSTFPRSGSASHEEAEDFLETDSDLAGVLIEKLAAGTLDDTLARGVPNMPPL